MLNSKHVCTQSQNMGGYDAKLLTDLELCYSSMPCCDKLCHTNNFEKKKSPLVTKEKSTKKIKNCRESYRKGRFLLVLNRNEHLV